MKIRNQHIANLVKRVKMSRGSLRSPQIMHPMREWVIGLGVAMVFFAVAAVWGATTYVSYRDAAVIETDSERQSNAAYQAQQVEQSLEIVRDRTREFESLLGISATPIVTESDSSDDDQVNEAGEVSNEEEEGGETVSSSEAVSLETTASSSVANDDGLLDEVTDEGAASSSEPVIESEVPTDT